MIVTPKGRIKRHEELERRQGASVAPKGKAVINSQAGTTTTELEDQRIESLGGTDEEGLHRLRHLPQEVRVRIEEDSRHACRKGNRLNANHRVHHHREGNAAAEMKALRLRRQAETRETGVAAVTTDAETMAEAEAEEEMAETEVTEETGTTMTRRCQTITGT